MKKVKKITLARKLADLFSHIRPIRIRVSAIILAAGSGTRMGAQTTKQWIEIDGVPTVVRSLAVFQNCRHVKEIIICAKRDELAMYDGFKDKYGLTKLKCVIAGGSTRMLSAFEGFKRISDKATHVAVHDAARCLLTPTMLNSVIADAVHLGAACAATKATDTVKLEKRGHYVESSPERGKVWLAQTPQIFETEIYRASIYVALRDGIEVTDDCSMAEHAGFAVKLVDCGKENIKLTEPVDVYIAEAILKKRSEGGK